MEDFIRELREKLDRATEALDEAEGKKYDLESFIDGLTNYRDELESLIDSLDSEPEFSESVELDLSFDSSY